MSTFERRRCRYCRYHGWSFWFGSLGCPYHLCASHLDLRLAYPAASRMEQNS